MQRFYLCTRLTYKAAKIMIRIESVSKYFRTEEIETVGLLDNPTEGNYYLGNQEVAHLKEKERSYELVRREYYFICKRICIKND